MKSAPFPSSPTTLPPSPTAPLLLYIHRQPISPLPFVPPGSDNPTFSLPRHINLLLLYAAATPHCLRLLLPLLRNLPPPPSGSHTPQSRTSQQQSNSRFSYVHNNNWDSEHDFHARSFDVSVGYRFNRLRRASQ